ncbi:MAG: LicD family protein [Ruminococcus sp.]|nr:LicD family protein [Ruminococcus sp.]
MIEKFDYSKIENYDELRKLQLTQIEILRVIHNFCMKNSIKYSIGYGNILGAVRHGGFIPWDDDLDICMLRNDYNKFIELWKDTDEYILQNHDTDRDFSQSFTKIRKRNTAFVQETDLGKNYHKGIFVDVFPFDRVPENKLRQKKQLLDAMLYNLFVREYIPTNNGSLMQLGSSLILKLSKKNKLPLKAKRYLKKICKYNDNTNLKLVDMSVVNTMRMHYDKNLLDDIVDIKFEDTDVKVLKDYDSFLKIRYGNYMKLPPEEQQTWYHHPVYVSFNKEYGEDKLE